MAESDLGDKTEAPTQRHREEAREQGTVARSPDLAAAALLIAAIYILKWWGPALLGTLQKIVAAMLNLAGDPASPAHIGQQSLAAVMSVGRAMLPLLIGVALIAAIVNLAQVGFFFNVNRIQPNFAVLNPLNGIKRLFVRGESAVRLLRNTLKMLLAAILAYMAIRARLADIISAQQLTFGQAFLLGAGLVYTIALRIGLLLFALAVLDYFYQRWNVEQSLKMSKQEIKEEMRRMEMSPLVRQRRRQIAIQRHTQRLKKEIPTADVVVTNPTHFAVALKYDEASMAAPRVIAKGQDILAQRIREIAKEAGVPILERRELARTLYRLVKVGQEIPEQFYATVAEILAFVYELNGKIARRKPRAAAAPVGGN